MTPETDSVSAARFESLCRTALTLDRDRNGIGTLGERTLHAVLKQFYEPDAAYREVKTGRFVADIRRGQSIVEVQTRAFRNLREKLPEFLTESSVKVVFPIAGIKYISWVEPSTGEIVSRRRSPKRDSLCDFMLELYELRPILPLEGLSFDVVSLEMEEYKLLSGRSRDRKHFGAARAERIPTRLLSITTLEEPEDFLATLPAGLGEEFTSAELASLAKISRNAAGKIISTLVTLGAIEKCGSRGRAYLYKRMVK